MLRQAVGFVLLVSGFPRLALPLIWSQHYLVGRVGSDMDITCPLKAESVWWEAGKRVVSYQRTLHLREVNEYTADTYTCADATCPSRTFTVYVLVQGRGSLNISCAADSYSSRSLLCSINHEFAGPVQVRAKAYRGSVSEAWERSHHDDGHVTFSVPIGSAFCLHGEHSKAFHVLLEVKTEKEYWRRDMPVSMTEVVTPGSPENLRDEGGQISWSPPSSWPHPTSYFPLLFQVSFRRRDNVKEEGILEATTYRRKNIREFRVRCRDLYSPSAPWSAWSPTIN